jgi:hypothetical protein
MLTFGERYAHGYDDDEKYGSKHNNPYVNTIASIVVIDYWWSWL